MVKIEENRNISFDTKTSILILIILVSIIIALWISIIIALWKYILS